MTQESFGERYKQALSAFVTSSSEMNLEQAYEIGRLALNKGLSLGEVGELHYTATHQLVADRQITFATLSRSEEFFLELATVYDMALRGYRETIARLQVEVEERRKAEAELLKAGTELARQRDLLEQRVEERTQALRSQADELTRSNDELRRSNQELDDFAHIASHDLKEPLRAISNHARFLKEDYGGALGEEGEHRLNRLIKLTQRMERLIAGLLYYSRLGRDVTASGAVDLAELITDIEADMADTLQVHNARVVQLGSLPCVIGNRAQLTVVFQNLINNALKYNNADEKIVEIGQAENEIADHATLYVRDNGIGIDAQFQDEVFRIFKRLNSEKAYGEGTGAGLTFVKKIIERHGGRIWFKSEPGQGTTFYFALKFAA